MLLSAGHWLVAALVLAGLAFYAATKGQSTGLLWKLLGAGAALAALTAWSKHKGAALPPSAGQDYRAAPDAGLPSGSKLPFAAAPPASPSAPAVLG